MVTINYFERTIESGKSPIVLSVWTPPAPEAAIVFIPATMVHPLFYEPLLRGFAERGLAVVGVHPVGHGKSSRTVKRFSVEDIVQNGIDAVTFAIGEFKIPVVVMGSSQGGIVAAAIAGKDSRIAAAFPHNIMLSELPDSLLVSRFPRFLRRFYPQAQAVFKFFARLFPGLALPLGFYLDRSRISTDPALWKAVEADPLCLKTYPLYFLASLITARFPGLTDGSIRCPLYVVADSGDKLFTADYTAAVFERLVAPKKEMVVFNFNDHMLMWTHPVEVCEKLTAKIKEAL
jgi:alpha-beta hydrolase superfamily lysophospholipase